MSLICADFFLRKSALSAGNLTKKTDTKLSFLKKNKLKNGDYVRAKAIFSFNKAKSEWGRKAVSIKKN